MYYRCFILQCFRMPLKYKEILPILKKEGFVFDHQTGSHQRYLHPLSGITTTVPFHSELKPKTAKSILNDIAKVKNVNIKTLIELYSVKL